MYMCNPDSMKTGGGGGAGSEVWDLLYMIAK